MRHDLAAELQTMHVTVHYFQLRNVALPKQYEKIIEEKEITRQQITTAEHIQKTKLIKAETSVKVAAINSEITVVNVRWINNGFNFIRLKHKQIEK